MPADRFTLEAAVDLQRAKEAVLQALDNRGYRVEKEFDAHIVAKHPFSPAYYPHEIDVMLDPKPTSTVISASIDHHSGQTYLKRLSDELVKLLPPLPARAYTPMEAPKTQDELNYQTKMLNSGFNAGEQVIWSHNVEQGVVHKETAQKWFITNMRAMKQFPPTDTDPQEKFTAVGWLDLTDSVVLNLVHKSRGSRVGVFAGAYAGHVLGGSGAGFSSGTSMTFGDVVFLHNGLEVLRFQGISDPAEVNNLVRTLKKEAANPR